MTLSDTIVGAIIGVSGMLVGLVFNFISDLLKQRHEDNTELRKKRAQVYMSIMEIIDYHSYETARIDKMPQDIIKQIHLTRNHIALYASPKVVKMYEEMYDHMTGQAKTEKYITRQLLNQIRRELGNKPLLKK